MTLYIFLFLISCVFAETVPLVNLLNLGEVEGTTKTSFHGKQFYSFEGVPYARPPVGKYRFREPVPVKPWHGVWKAKNIYKCMQYYQYTPPGGDSVIGDEDCLYLNIYTPTLDESANLDVLVYIHGGAFMFNWGGIYKPDYILDKNLVYINLNYRLGSLGFLSLENDMVPGNNGLKDQIMALQWVQTYVKNFGGNPNSVTIFGMSAGGASVQFHYLSPKSQNLFHRGISQSGSMLNAWTIFEDPLEKSKKLASALGCETKNLKHMVCCLRRKPGRQIVAATKEFQPWLYNPFSPFGPLVDSFASDPVLPEHPYKLLKDKKVKNSPWIISYTNSEGLYPGAGFYKDEILKELDERWDEILPHILHYNYTVDPKLRDSVSQKIREYYLKDKKLDKDSFMNFINILTDRLFAVNVEKAALLQNEATTSPVYFYHFAYRGAHSKSESRSGSSKDFGAAHGDDTCYIFKTDVDTSSTPEDQKMIEVLTEIVSSFVKTGKPNTSIEWVPLSTSSKLKYLKISSPTNLKMEPSVLNTKDFWDSLPIIENEKMFESTKREL